jgi:hypothetical protein
MRGRAEIGVGMFLLFVVLAVCISPFIDLAPTILRSQALAKVVFATIALAGSAVLFRIPRLSGAWEPAINWDDVRLLQTSLLDLKCARRC